MKRIPISRGMFALIDDEDSHRVLRYRWHAYPSKSTWYAKASAWDHIHKKQFNLPMGRFIMDAPKEKCVDHINGDGLDNRKSNLRICTNAENSRNQKMKPHSSRFKGVTWNARLGNWVAQIRANGTTKHLGVFTDECDAAKAYNVAAMKHFGRFARLNEVA